MISFLSLPKTYHKPYHTINSFISNLSKRIIIYKYSTLSRSYAFTLSSKRVKPPFLLFKRFVHPKLPSPQIINTAFPKITEFTTKRIIKLLSRGPLLENAQRILPNDTELSHALRAWRELSNSRADFFKSIRKASEQKTLPLPSDFFNDLNKINMCKVFARFARAQNYPSYKPEDLLSTKEYNEKYLLKEDKLKTSGLNYEQKKII